MVFGIIVRLIFALAALAGSWRLLSKALPARKSWRDHEAGITRAEQYWSKRTSGPFDQYDAEIPADVRPYLGARGPRTDLRSPIPANAEFIWGWVLLALAALLVLSIIAQFSSGLS